MPKQVVRPSVRPSVTLRYDDHVVWNTSKNKFMVDSQRSSMSADSNIIIITTKKFTIYCKGNITKF